jgi:hypothetical protein
MPLSGAEIHARHFRGIPPLRTKRARMGHPQVFLVRKKSKSKAADGGVRPTLDYCLILGFTAEYSKSVRKFTATYVNPIARMHPCTR